MRVLRTSSLWGAAALGVVALGVLPAHAQFDEEPPSVIGRTVAEAEETLRDWQADAEIRLLNSAPPQVDPAEVVILEQSLANPGWSIEQIPPVVELTLGAAMPYLEGRSWAEARALLEESGLAPSPLLDGASDDLVVTLAPTAGLPVAFGSEVRVKLEPAVASTPEPAQPIEVEVPVIVGLRADEAEALLADAGLRMELDVIGDQGEIGPIVAQDPEARTTVEADTIVTATAERVTSETPATDTAGEDGTGRREGTDRRWIILVASILVGVLVAVAAGAVHRMRRRARDHRDLDWIDQHLAAVPRPDAEPALATQAEPGKPHHDVSLVGERGTTPTFTEEVSKR